MPSAHLPSLAEKPRVVRQAGRGVAGNVDLKAPEMGSQLPPPNVANAVAAPAPTKR
jgi:hypothetical protein